MDSSCRRLHWGRPLYFVHRKRRASIDQPSDADIRDRKAALRSAARADRDALQSGLGAASATGLVARFHNTPALRALMTPANIFAGYMPLGIVRLTWRELTDRKRSRFSRSELTPLR